MLASVAASPSISSDGGSEANGSRYTRLRRSGAGSHPSNEHAMIQESDVGQWLAIRKETGLKIDVCIDPRSLWRLSRSARGMPASWTKILRPIPGSDIWVH